MKNARKLFITSLSLTATALMIAPIATSCSNAYANLNIVDRGDGTYFASASNSALSLSFDEQVTNTMLNSSGYSAFKDQYANQLLYNWYKGVVDEGKIQSFKDNWSEWTDDIDDDYDDQVQSYKDSHGSSWRYYFQNEVLDPNGGTEASWKYQQMVSKIRDAISDLVFAKDYLAYAANPCGFNTKVDIFDQTTFNDASSWKNIDFYAQASGGSLNNTEDDVYSQIQKATFELWTAQDHPISVAMSLWEYAAPDAGMRSIYSDYVPNNSSSGTSTVGVTDDDDDDDELVPTYEVPAFPEFDGSSLNANGKFYMLMSAIKNSSSACLDSNGFINFSNISSFTDDSDISMIVSANTAFTDLDQYFAGAVASLWNTSGAAASGLLPYNIDYTIPDQQSDTDILSNFFFKSNDDRIFSTTSANTLTSLGENLASLAANGYVLNLADNFKYVEDGNKSGGDLSTGVGSSTFHSLIFNPDSYYPFDYYGNLDSEGGVQFVVGGLRLLIGDSSSNASPYVLIRDTYGVHLVAINGLETYDSVNGFQSGYLLQPASDDNNNTEPLSQERENYLLKAQYLAQQNGLMEGSGIDIASAIKTYFESNMDDVIIMMAHDQTQDSEGNVIFDDSKLVQSADRDTLYDLISAGNAYFLLQLMVTDFNSANSKLLSDKITNVTNSLISRSDEFKGNNASNWSNCLSLAYPFTLENASSGDSTILQNTTFYDVSKFALWVNLGSWNSSTTSDSNLNLGEDTWAGSVGLTINFYGDNNSIESYKNEFVSALNTLAKNDEITPYIEKSIPGSLSEHIYPEWDDTYFFANGIYMAMNAYGSQSDFANSVKLKAMEKYAEDKLGITVNSENGMTPDFSSASDAVKIAVTSLYYTDKLFTTSTPLSYYVSQSQAESFSNTSDYTDFLIDEYDKTFDNNFTSTASDDLVSLWTYIDAIAYLVDNDYANLMDQLQSVVNWGTEADIVWGTWDNNCNASAFNNNDSTLSQVYGWQNNYMGMYDNTYLGGSNSSTPTSYASNPAYYHYAPMNSSTIGMGYMGLVTTNENTSNLTDQLKSALFTDTYKTKYTTSGTTTSHLGGWVKYGNDINDLITYIQNNYSSVYDIQTLVTNLQSANNSQNFIQAVCNHVSQTTFGSDDPELACGYSAGESIPPEVLKGRLIGGTQTYNGVSVDYDSEGWGLQWYEDNYGTEVSNMFTRYGDSAGPVELWNGYDQSHAISDDDLGLTRLAVIQLNSNDVSDASTLQQALSTDSNVQQELMYLLAAQFAAKSNIQSRAISDVIAVEYDGNKLTVFDRRLNDDLGATWVNDYQTTN